LTGFAAWLLMVLFASLPGPLSADTNGLKGYLIDVWQSDRGLPQNTVTGIAQTPDGYLWVSTLDGLARFDGVRFKVFKPGNTLALGSGRLRGLARGRGGGLWIATQEGDIIRYDEGRFAAFLLPEFHGARPDSRWMAEDEAGILWLASDEGTVSRLDNGH
jgi:ligand-binding sensor domain-containing protein